MGNISSVYGKIVSARYNYGGNVNLDNDPLLYHKLNRITIDQLPEIDDYPQLTRQMFNLPSLKWEDGLYKHQIIAFGASYKQIEESWYEWVFKFENLLKHLYWIDAVVHLETELRGNRTYRWTNKNEQPFKYNSNNNYSNWEHSGDDILEFENGNNK